MLEAAIAAILIYTIIVEFTFNGRTVEGVIANIDRALSETWYKVHVTGTRSSHVKIGETHYFSSIRAARELTPKRAAEMSCR